MPRRAGRLRLVLPRAGGPRVVAHDLPLGALVAAGLRGDLRAAVLSGRHGERDRAPLSPRIRPVRRALLRHRHLLLPRRLGSAGRVLRSAGHRVPQLCVRRGDLLRPAVLPLGVRRRRPTRVHVREPRPRRVARRGPDRLPSLRLPDAPARQRVHRAGRPRVRARRGDVRLSPVRFARRPLLDTTRLSAARPGRASGAPRGSSTRPRARAPRASHARTCARGRARASSRCCSSRRHP